MLRLEDEEIQAQIKCLLENPLLQQNLQEDGFWGVLACKLGIPNKPEHRYRLKQRFASFMETMVRPSNSDQAESGQEAANAREGSQEQDGASTTTAVSHELAIIEIPLPLAPLQFSIEPKDWAKLTAKRHSTGFQGLEWTIVISKGIRTVFPYCSFGFKRHHLKRPNSSRKGPLFSCLAYCRFEDCKVEAKVTLESLKTLSAKLVLDNGPARHYAGDRKSRPVRASDRTTLGERLQTEKPRAMHVRDVGALSEAVFDSGCRDLAPPVSVLKNVSYDVRKRRRLHHNEIQSLERMLKLPTNDTSVLKNVLLKPKGVMLWSLRGIQIYQERCKEDIVYLDATGSLLRSQKSNPPFYIYELVVRHPKKGGSPLPVATYITCDHTTASVTYFLMSFVTDVKRSHGHRVVPLMVMCDGSQVLMQSISFAFANRGLTDILAVYFRIATGKAVKTDWQVPVLHRCLSHIMKNAKEMCKKHAPQCYALAMHIFGLFTTASTVHELEDMVYSAAVLFGSPCVGPLVEHHFAHLQALMVHLPSPMEVDNEAVVDLEEDETDWGRHLSTIIEGAPRDMVGEQNLYHSEGLLTHLSKFMLPYAGLWSGIMLGDLGRHGQGQGYTDASKRHTKPTNLQRQNITMANHTQGIMEKSQWDLKHLRFQSRTYSRLDDVVLQYQALHKSLLREYRDTARVFNMKRYQVLSEKWRKTRRRQILADTSGRNELPPQSGWALP
ncbi:unnamed protein product [Knipowitschia caucasica]